MVQRFETPARSGEGRQNEVDALRLGTHKLTSSVTPAAPPAPRALIMPAAPVRGVCVLFAAY